ncbi:MAG TPA: hypothetical protein VIL42_07065 [Sphingomicrobium sp.]|jgi:hypothetical protein
MMRLIAFLLLLVSSAHAAGQSPVPPVPSAWNPAAPYVTVGQDEPGYRAWYLAAPERALQVRAFNDYLSASRVAGILPTWQLLRTATSWRDCGAQPFEVPPSSEWPNIVNTLRYVRDFVVPAIGPVEAVSVYRNPQLNVCAGGAVESAHKLDSAIDMVPLRPIQRVTLMRALCSDHNKHGSRYRAGLGFYAFVRFHVDSTKFRRWNMDPAVAAECPPIVHVEDANSIGRPLTPAPSTALPQPAATASPPPAPERGNPQ